jgi:asparagine synthase (glutamine-hydrolysing)
MISGIEFRGEWEAGILALHGVDLRDPTSDLDVAQFCLGIPDQQYLAEGINRSVIRRAMWNLLLPTVLANRKRGLQAADWFGKLSRRRETMADEVRRLRTSSLAAEAINLKQLERLVEDWPRQIDSRDDRRRIEAYQFALLGGLSAGRFLQLFERSNPPSSSATNLN